MNLAILSAQDNAFRENRKTVKGRRTATGHQCISKNSIVEGHIYAVAVAVKSHRLHINVGTQQVCTAHLGTGSTVQHRLRITGQVDTQILNAILIPTAVCNLLCMDGQRLIQILCTAVQGLFASIRPGITSFRE